MSIESIFTGLALIGIGFILVQFYKRLADSLGAPAFIDRIFGPGREYAFYKLLGVCFILLGFGTMVGFHAFIIDLIFSPFRNLLD